MFFRIFFEKMAESFENSVGRQKSWNVVSKLKFGKNFWIKTQTRTYCNLSYIFSPLSSSEEKDEEEEEDYKKSFFRSAENFRYGKAGKLNMLTFRKKFKQLTYGYENSF